jgi:hypothetical protein
VKQLEIDVMAADQPAAPATVRYRVTRKHYRFVDGKRVEWRHNPRCYSCQGTGDYDGRDRSACPCGEAVTP